MIPDAVIEALARAKSVAALTGAGISAESGIPTFRGAGGLWKNHDAIALATPEAFARDPDLVWEFYEWRRQKVHESEPNAGHRTLVDMERTLPAFTLVTQNVDGLHERAGSTNVIRLHGSLWTLRCTREGTEVEDHRVPLPDVPPKCPCGAMLRPGVVWFGEALPPGALERAARAVTGAEVFLVIGTSCQVYPAAGLVPTALAAGVTVVEVNVEAAADFPGVHHLVGPSGEILPELWRLARS
jgi:NAD-dependent deacetylase